MNKKPSPTDFSNDQWTIFAPDGLKKLVQFALTQRKNSSNSSGSQFDHYLFPGFYWGGSVLKLFGVESCGSGRYPGAPPEFFPFASLGEDGIYYGYVLHAPELNISNPPIGIFDPIPNLSNQGVKLLGNSFEHALDRLLSEALGFYCTDEQFQMIDAIATLLNVQPSFDKRNRRYMEYDEPIVPAIPTGWHFEPSGDGVGVLAPREAFVDHSPTCETWSFDIFQGKGCPIVQNTEAALQLVEKCLRSNAPGSALFILRELHWRSSDERVFQQSKELWKDAYSQLQRPLLSDVVEEEVKLQQQREAAYRLQLLGNETVTELMQEWNDVELMSEQEQQNDQ